MSYKIKVLLSRNDGDWRRRSAVILKATSTTTFSEFVTKCAHKLYPNQSNTIYSSIQLYDIQNGLTPIDDEPNTLLSELHEDHDVYRNCQILVILPLFHKEGIINPSAEQKTELQQEKELSSYLSSPSTSISSHPLYASSSSIALSPSMQSTSRSFHTLASLNKANNLSIGNNNSLSPKIKEPRNVLLHHSDTKDNKDIAHNIVDDEDDELVCTLRNEDDASETKHDRNDMKSNDSITGKRARTDFKPSCAKRPRKKRKKRHKNKDNVDIYDDASNLKINETENNTTNIDKNKNNKNKISTKLSPRKNGKDSISKKKKKKYRDKSNTTAKKDAVDHDPKHIEMDTDNNNTENDGNSIDQPLVSRTQNEKIIAPTKRKNTKTKKSDKEEMDEESDTEMHIDAVDADNAEDNSSTEYEEIVEYMMLEMKVGNSDSFNLHQYNECVLKNMLNEKQMLPTIKLKNKGHEEYEGIYSQTLGSHLFFKQMDICEENENEHDIHETKDQNQMEYVNKAEVKCVFSRFKPRIYS